MLRIYLSENSDADVLTTGFIDEGVQLLRWKWAEKKTAKRDSVELLCGNSIIKTFMFLTYTVMTLSLGSGGRPTVSCL